MSRGDEPHEQPETEGRAWSASVRAQDDALGVIVDLQNVPQHVIAASEFIAADAADEADWPGEASWQNLYITAFVRWDSHLQQQYPDNVTVTGIVNTLYIDVPGARLDYVAPGTFVGVEDTGEAFESSTGGYIQDDRTLLKDIAYLAYQWYSQERQALQVAVHSLATLWELGEIIAELRGENGQQTVINSAITQIDMNTRAGMTTIRTEFAELDAKAYSPKLFGVR
jgi:hypothetical protein